MIHFIIKNISNLERCKEIYDIIQPLNFGLDLTFEMENGDMIIEFIAIDDNEKENFIKFCNNLQFSCYFL